MSVEVCGLGIWGLRWGSIGYLWGCEYSFIGSLYFNISLSSVSGRNGNFLLIC